MLEREI